MAELRACFRRIDITPNRPVSLLGYFNDRVSAGVLDPLHCRLAGVYLGGEALLFAQVDTCLLSAGDAEELRAALSRASGCPPERVMVFASHTHTAPALADLYAVRRDGEYFRFVKESLAGAAASLQPELHVAMKICRGRAPGLASNRRWRMVGGEVVTNPPRMHPLLDRPEGPVDDEVNTIAFVTPDGAVPGMLVSISNHTDTIGGDLVSADWPGIMEAEIRSSFGPDTVVVPLIGAAGNINHFDFRKAADHPSPVEARRIGRGYAEVVSASMARGADVAVDGLHAARRVLGVPALEVPDSEVRRAREIISRTVPVAAAAGTAAAAAADLTAEDIFAGDPAVERVFAGALLDLMQHRPEQYSVPLQCFRAGPVGFFAVPGEPFVETGLALKSISGPGLAVPVGLANGYFGYIPLRECFTRDGYEVKPGPALLCRGAADMLLAALREMASELF